MFKYDVLCLGSATLDNFLMIEQPFQSVRLGDKVLVKSMEKHSGGGATNAAAAFSKLGLKAKLLTKLGKDHDAEFILQELKQYKLKNICRHHSQQQTDFSTIITYGQNQDRIIYVHKGASQDLNVTDFKKSQLKADWIYLATLMGRSLQIVPEIVEYAKQKNIKILFNPSLYLAKKGQQLSSILKHVELLVLNKEEAQALLRSKKDLKPLLLPLQQLGPHTVVITDGPRRMYALHQNQVYSLLPPKVKVVHTAGAGDAFTAGLLAGMIKGYSFAEALKLGQVNANSVIQHLGTKNKLLTEHEAKQLMSRVKVDVS